jgi:hydrogenase maturation protein HypF
VSLTRLPQPAPARMLACGAFLKNTACLLQGDEVLWSAEHGDLSTPEACVALEASLEHLLAQASGPVQAVAHDLHPDFHSTRLAHQLAQRLGVPAVAVQHHQAHIAVVQAEQGLGEVLGLALDGVGLGTDGSAWGGELLHLAAGGAQWQRLAHLPALALPGGDVAAREPWRMAAAALHAAGLGEQIEARIGAALAAEPGAVAGSAHQAARLVAQMLARGLNCPATTAAGRWFDAVAGLLGLNLRQRFETEAAIALERCATEWLAQHPEHDEPMFWWDDPSPRPSPTRGEGALTDLLTLVPQLDPTQAGEGAARFHHRLAAALAHATVTAAQQHNLHTVVLGGGCFFNALLSRWLTARLRAAGLQVHRPQTLSCGDAGLALGQAWVAAAVLAST